MAKRRKSDVVLNRYFNDLKYRTLADFKNDPVLLHKLFDQYHKAVGVLQEQKSAEDTALNRLISNKHPNNDTETLTHHCERCGQTWEIKHHKDVPTKILDCGCPSPNPLGQCLVTQDELDAGDRLIDKMFGDNPSQNLGDMAEISKARWACIGCGKDSRFKCDCPTKTRDNDV